jgi:hypothetical protein
MITKEKVTSCVAHPLHKTVHDCHKNSLILSCAITFTAVWLMFSSPLGVYDMHLDMKGNSMVHQYCQLSPE